MPGKVLSKRINPAIKAGLNNSIKSSYQDKLLKGFLTTNIAHTDLTHKSQQLHTVRLHK